MGRMRGLVPLTLATGLGILNGKLQARRVVLPATKTAAGVMVFQPAFAELRREKLHKEEEEQYGSPRVVLALCAWG